MLKPSADSALSQALELSKAERPNQRELDFFRRWLIRPSMGDNFLTDIEQTIWDESNTRDLVTLFPRILQRDYLTSLLDGYLLDIYDRIWGHRRKVCHLNSKLSLENKLTTRPGSNHRPCFVVQISGNTTKPE